MVHAYKNSADFGVNWLEQKIVPTKGQTCISCFLHRAGQLNPKTQFSQRGSQCNCQCSKKCQLNSEI